MEEDAVIVRCITPDKTFYRGIMDAVSALRESGFSRSYESVKRRALRLAGCYYEKPRQRQYKPRCSEEDKNVVDKVNDLERRVASLENILSTCRSSPEVPAR